MNTGTKTAAGTIPKLYLICVYWLSVDLYSKNAMCPLTFWVQFCHLLCVLLTQQQYGFWIYMADGCDGLSFFLTTDL